MTTNLTDLRNQLALETLDDETLDELVQFRRETTEHHISQGNKVQAIMHNAVLSALIELREFRKAKRKSVAYLVCNGRLYQDRPFLSFSSAQISVKDRNDGAEIKPLYIDTPAPVVPVGWKLVPVEPNGDMLAAAQDAFGETAGDIASTLRAAIAAAPQEVK